MGFDCMYRIFRLGGLACSKRMYVFAGPEVRRRRRDVILSGGALPQSSIIKLLVEKRKESPFRIFFILSPDSLPFFYFTISALGGRWRTSCVVVYTFPIISFRRYTPVMRVCMYTHTHP